MSSKYKNIQVKSEVVDKLKEVAAMMNSFQSDKLKKNTVAGLVTMLADAYDVDCICYRDWKLDGHPIIVTSDGAKHFEELRLYKPRLAAEMVDEFVRSEAMAERFGKIIASENKDKS